VCGKRKKKDDLSPQVAEDGRGACVVDAREVWMLQDDPRDHCGITFSCLRERASDNERERERESVCVGI
jgi:hypothetical protein